MRQDLKYEGGFRRFFASMIDQIFLIPVFLLTEPLIELLNQINPSALLETNTALSLAVILLISLVIIGINYVLVASQQGQTIGKRLLKIRVINNKGEVPSKKLLFWRTFLFFGINAFIKYIPLITVFFTKKKLAVHDMLASTYVIKN